MENEYLGDFIKGFFNIINNNFDSFDNKDKQIKESLLDFGKESSRIRGKGDRCKRIVYKS